MKDINKIIDSLSPVEQILMYNALQKKLNRGPEYTISYDKSGYYIKCDSPQLTAFRFEEMAKGRMCYAEIGIFEIPVGATVYINYGYREVVSTDIKYLGLLEE